MSILVTILCGVLSTLGSLNGKIDLVGMSKDGSWAGITVLEEAYGDISSSKTYYVIDLEKNQVFSHYDDQIGPTAFNSLGIGSVLIDSLDSRQEGKLIRQRRGDGTWELLIVPTDDGIDLQFKPTLEKESYNIGREIIAPGRIAETISYRISEGLATKHDKVIFVLRTMILNSDERIPDTLFILDPETRVCTRIE